MGTVEAALRPQLVKDLRAQVTALERDLLARAGDVAEFAEHLDVEYRGAREAERTAAGFTEWRQGRVTQAAAAWVLATVFIRYSEDNGLIGPAFLAGPGERLVEAEERHDQYFREHPTENDRDWLFAAIAHLSAAHPTAAGLFDKRHNPLWELTPSFEAATALIAFWRRRDDEGDIRYDFTGWDTRFLGDLYQDLSEAARKTYALLQTPEFIEEFILDLTLTPALEEFGLDGLRTIDPACGSGHFLLGLFRRILAAWRAQEPGTNDWELIRRSLTSVHGCDKNPFAASVARFRLMVAALVEAEEPRLSRARAFPVNIAVGDSLLHGRGVLGEQTDLLGVAETYTYTTEDVNNFVHSCDMLDVGSYHAVVANPPYITVKDERENHAYRERYDACGGGYALSVPFAQRLFWLAIQGNGEGIPAGYVGQITANSFMKREFGHKLVERFLPTVQLAYVIDTSGAYIPGHGTPTVIMIGRNHVARLKQSVRTVRGIRGEPSQPSDPARGMVWRAILDQYRHSGSASAWVSVEDTSPETLREHPWMLSGGGASEVVRQLESESMSLRTQVESIGRTTATGADDAYFLPSLRTAARLGDSNQCRQLVIGDSVRDYRIDRPVYVRSPYTDSLQREPVDPASRLAVRSLWPARTLLSNRVIFGESIVGHGRQWYEHLENYASKLSVATGIAFAFVATHNHFVFDKNARLFNRTAPVIKLPAGASENEHLGLLGVLNSSAACFWLKQVSQAKAGGGTGRGMQDEAWEERYEFTGTKLQEYPLPADLPLPLGSELDRLAGLLAEEEPSAVCERAMPTRDDLDRARVRQASLRQEMITLQEELDWTVYRSYDLITETEAKALISDSVPEPLALGERAFEIILARRQAAGEVETAWFDRHGSTPITELPAHWSPEYRAIVEARIDVIENRRDIALIERPDCKRRWATQPWEKKETAALRAWLLDRCEAPELWAALRDGVPHPRTLTVSRLGDLFEDDKDFVAVAQLYAADHLGKRDLTLAQVLESVVADEHVPYLAALRYKDSGLVTRAEWERTWELQREEDRTCKNLNIAVPAKYKPADFRKTSYWSQRGKLDVPKERFISYPGASPDADPMLLLGWAGWDHKDQAQALVNLVNDRTTQAGWDDTRVTPLLAGLAEVLPWVHQWHGEFDEAWGGNPAEEYQAYLEEQRTQRGLTIEALREWRPEPPTRGRKPKGSA